MKEYNNIPIIDCHVHIGKDFDNTSYLIDDLLKDMKRSNIKKSIIFPFNDINKGINFTKINSKMLKYSVDSTKVIPFFRLNPNLAWKNEFKNRVVEGFKGLKLHPVSQKFDLLDKNVLEVYKFAEESNIIILFHTGFSMSNIGEKLNKISKQFPNLKIILGHSVFIDIEQAFKLLKNNKNIFFDISTVKGYDLYKILLEISHKKILFGSDASYYRQSQQLRNLFKYFKVCGITQNQATDILYNNTAKLLNLNKINLKKKLLLFNIKQSIQRMITKLTKYFNYSRMQTLKIYHISLLAKNLVNTKNIFKLSNRFDILITIASEKILFRKTKQMDNIIKLSSKAKKTLRPYINSNKTLPKEIKLDINDIILNIIEYCNLC